MSCKADIAPKQHFGRPLLRMRANWDTIVSLEIPIQRDRMPLATSKGGRL
jgi:hypothetical protein